MKRVVWKAALVALSLVTPGSALAADPVPANAIPAPTTAPAVASIDTSHAWHLHLPGIAGEAGIDHNLVEGLRDAGYDGPSEIYDWTGDQAGLTAPAPASTTTRKPPRSPRRSRPVTRPTRR